MEDFLTPPPPPRRHVAPPASREDTPTSNEQRGNPSNFHTPNHSFDSPPLLPPPLPPHTNHVVGERVAQPAQFWRTNKASFFAFVVIGLIFALLLTVDRRHLVNQLHPWLYPPTTESVVPDLKRQLADLLPNTAEANIVVSDVSVIHRRGDSSGTWSATARIQLTVSRYMEVQWAEELTKRGFDSDSFTTAKTERETLTQVEVPVIPALPEHTLVGEIAKAGENIVIPLTGQLLSEAESWAVSVNGLSDERTRIERLLHGKPFEAYGEGAVRADSQEAQETLQTFITEGNQFISDIARAKANAEKAKAKAEEERVSKQEEMKASASGLVQASWYALERLSKCLTNIETNRRLIEIATEQNDRQKRALYRSYEIANDENIQDASSSYIKAIRDLSKLPVDVRDEALRVLNEEIEAFSIPWKTALVEKLNSDAQSPPAFDENWMGQILNLRDTPRR